LKYTLELIADLTAKDPPGLTLARRQAEPVDSPFLSVPQSEWIAENDLAFAFHDRFPVSPGHALVVTRRVTADWWSASDAERAALMDLVGQVKLALDEMEPRPDGYNIGFNAGAAAGQTIDHLHVHVIPRYRGDMRDPSGGVRHVIPWRGNYLAPTQRALHDGPGRALGPSLADAFADPDVDEVRLAVSFVMASGLRIIDESFVELLSRAGARLRLLTSDYLDVTEPVALRRLLADQVTFPALQVRLFVTDRTGFHPKAYLLTSRERPEVAVGFVGSANLSRSGLESSVEWTLRTARPHEVAELVEGFEALWEDPRSHPLTEAVLAEYESRRIPPVRTSTGRVISVIAEEAPLAPTPTQIQVEALAALEQSRAVGFGAGLVVLATGLGKTWLAAFDSSRPQFRRVLFVAHREELLRQAMVTFRTAQPTRTTGLLMSDVDESEADAVFASVQTLARHLDRYRPDEFDYLVVDEFHHAAATTYRKVLNHFRPTFLLGLTATPDRTDGADLLALCDDNVVHEVSLVEGIRRSALVPFRYHGVLDTIDFDPIPWRNGGFDPAALENAAVTEARSRASFDAWERLRGHRTLGFCVSVRHADHQAAFFRARGVRAVAVHNQPWSAPRHQAIADLRSGELDVLFSVDLFNEGLDVPTVDTVLMLRPTASPILFLQQLGRGLRSAPGKADLVVIDFVGNHRSFLNRPQELLRLAGVDHDRAATRRALETGDFSLPPGCSVDYDVDAIDLLKQLAGVRSRGSALEAFAKAAAEAEGHRPSAMEAYRRGYNPAAANRDGGWHALLKSLDLLEPEELEAVAIGGELLTEVGRTAMTKSYKMLVLRALVMTDHLFNTISLAALSDACRHLVLRDPRLVNDLRSKEIAAPELMSAEAFTRYWRKWPIAAWAGELGRGERAWARIADDSFTLRIEVPEHLKTPLTELVAELVDWRLAKYLDNRETIAGAILKVSHAGGRPILFLDRTRNPELPTGPVDVVTADGTVYELDFVKVAVNVAHRHGGSSNELPGLLRSWFGDDAGHAGTAHRVHLAQDAGGVWRLTPLGGPELPAPAVGETGP
jgi:superfamily II DNA or RNA helicase/diadenosine tetraphosphate (Ap4A) HIT family hydrolase/HKD family nuclease